VHSHKTIKRDIVSFFALNHCAMSHIFCLGKSNHQRIPSALGSPLVGQHPSRNAEQPRERVRRDVFKALPHDFKRPRQRFRRRIAISSRQQVGGDSAKMLINELIQPQFRVHARLVAPHTSVMASTCSNITLLVKGGVLPDFGRRFGRADSLWCTMPMRGIYAPYTWNELQPVSVDKPQVLPKQAAPQRFDAPAENEE
jgi:hypothetical protein